MNEIEDTPLYQEAQDILANGETNTNFGWRILIHYGENLTLDPLKVISLNNVRDYAKGFTDVMTLTVMMGLGQYAHRIYKNRDTLQVSITKLPQSELGEDGDEDAAMENEIFSASLIDQDRSPIDAQSAEANSEEALDLTDIVEVHFQLFNKSLEQIRMMTVGGSFRNERVSNLLQAMLTREAAKADVDNERAISGVDIVPVSNTDVKQQIVVTHGVKLVDLPDFLQKKIGIYSSGLGSYIQNKFWHIFPLYDTGRFEDRQQTLTILLLPQRKFSGVERTYRLQGDSLTVLMTGETAFKDDSGTNYVNEGNGARFANAESIMEGVTTNSGNKAVMSRARNASEFMAQSRPDGIEHVPMAATRITSNPFPILSELAGRNGGLFKGVWQNSDPKLLLPGMAVRIIYSNQGETQEMYGVLHGAEHVSHRLGDITSEKMNTQSVVYVFVTKPKVVGE